MTHETNNEDIKVHLKGRIEITLHTHQAQALMQGSWRENHLGLSQFSRKLMELWTAYKKHDPYAYWYLIKISQMQETIHDEIKTIEVQCQDKLSGLRGNVQLFSSTAPKNYVLDCNLPFFNITAFLIADVDYALRQSYTCKHLGIALPLDQLPEKVMIPKMRALFSLPLQWKNTGLTWNDYNEANTMQEKAIAAMGELPDYIRNKHIQSIYLK